MLPDAVVDGWVAVDGERIAEVGEGRAPERGIDLGGDLLAPGLIELHTDHLESHLKPRPKVHWPAVAAVVAYDAQIAASGITTVFDSLRVGNDARLWLGQDETGRHPRRPSTPPGRRACCAPTIACTCAARSAPTTWCEQTERLLDRHAVGLISLMDHTPGARQFVDLGGLEDLLRRQVGSARGRARPLHGARSGRGSRANYASHRAALVALARARGVVMASHDDATPEHVQESIADGVAIAEFPTTAGGRRGLASRPASPC